MSRSITASEYTRNARPPTRGSLGLERVPEIDVRDPSPELDASLAGEPVVQSRPEAGVHDFIAQLLHGFEMPDRVEIAGGAGGVEAVDVDVDSLRAEKRLEDFRHRRGQRSVRGGILGMVRRGRQRPPAGLFDRV